MSPSVQAVDFASPQVSLLEPYYRDVEKLISHGLIQIYISGQKPYSRGEFARLTAEAMQAYEKGQSSYSEDSRRHLASILEKLKKEFHSELIQLGAIAGEKKRFDFNFFHQLRFQTVLTNTEPRGFADNGLGLIDARTNPLTAYQEGRHFSEGGQFSWESSHWLSLTPYWNLYVEPRFEVRLPTAPAEESAQIYLNRLASEVNFKNFELNLGRDLLFWGQGKKSGLMLSQNTRALDKAQISNDSPFILPWIFKYLGPSKFSFFYADLGPEQHFSHSYLTGFKLSFKPFSFFELGFSHLVISGGEGAPEGSFGERLGGVFPFVQTFSGSQVEIDNKLGGFDTRVRIPQARNLELYLEGVFDDTPASAEAFFLDDGAYLGGIYVPRFNESGSLDLRVEFHRTGVRYYRHGQFQSGWALNPHILGDELGPDAYGFYSNLGWDISPQHLLNFSFDYEHRSNDFYIGPRAVFGRFKKTLEGPKEERYRVQTEWTYRPEQFPFLFKSRLGYERVQNFNFIQGDDRHHVLADVVFQMELDSFFRKKL